jgi:hypothetical protein
VKFQSRWDLATVDVDMTGVRADELLKAGRQAV